MRSAAGGKRFKLDALVDIACEPLQQLLGEKKYLLSNERPTSLDCLALGYLSLALKPEVPQSWLRDSLRKRYSSLCKYVERGIEECFSGEVTSSDAFLATDESSSLEPTRIDQTNSSITASKLPWRPPQTGLQAAGPMILHSMLATLPSSLKPTTHIRTTDASSSPNPFSYDTSTSKFMAAATAVAAIAATTASYALYSFLSAPDTASDYEKGKKERKLEDMGEAGAMFAGIDFGPVHSHGE